MRLTIVSLLIIILAILSHLILLTNAFFTKPLGKASIQKWNPVIRLSARKLNKEISPEPRNQVKNSKDSSQGTSPSSVPPANPAKLEALQGVLHSIERSYGKGTIQKLGESPTMTVETTSSGSMTLDIALGGGYPRGRVIEIYGPESSGKTTLALHAAAEIQKNGGMAAFIDAEHALDPVYARNLGVNVNDLFVCQPDSGEMALDVVDQLVRSSAFDLIVIDSVAALVPRAELEGDMQDAQMGLQARLMSKALRKITGSLSRSQTTVIFLNQLRSKIGIMFGNPEVTAGGNALKFYASVRLDIRRKEILKDQSGITVRVKVVKNKVAPPFQSIEMEINFGSGIDRLGCLVDAAESTGILVRKGSWYYYGAKEENIAQGKRAMIEYCQQQPEFASWLTSEVRTKLAQRALATPTITEENDSEEQDYLELEQESV